MQKFSPFFEKAPKSAVKYDILYIVSTRQHGKEGASMKRRAKRWFLTAICLLLAVVSLSAFAASTAFYSGGERFYLGSAKDYYQSLLSKGFPSDYASSLTELHLLHPDWTFEPLLITRENPTYTWDYVIEKETEEPDTNLIYSEEKYLPYQHPTNFNQYDSGYYQASVEAVEYFMDPRNFLNEADVFQFFDLSASSVGSTEAVKAVLRGTFMEDGVLENGYTYAAYFVFLGEELGINPVYLAAKARQEQGVGGTSPIISGQCGSLLSDYYINRTPTTESGTHILPPSDGHTPESLKALNGYYNFYNVGASGNGLFSIYHNAMERAVKGTESMSELWGGSPAWNTKWKSLYGGAYMIKNSYVDCYQSTVYLQKFNVDSRAEESNFWKQYMQNVTGAMSEARSIYASFAAIDALDLPCTFLIPVFGEMPASPALDPALGSCESLTPASARYTYSTAVTSPVWQGTKSMPLYHSLEATYGSPLRFSGALEHSYGVDKVEYRLDNGDWITVSDNGSFDFSISTDLPEGSSHILVLRGTAAYDTDTPAKKNNFNFLGAVFYLTAIRPDVTLSVEIDDTITQSTHKAGSTVTLPTCDYPDFAGWLSSDGNLYPSGADIKLDRALNLRAVLLSFQHLEGAAISTDSPVPHLRFSAILDRKAYEALTSVGENTVSIFSALDSPLAEQIRADLTPVTVEDADEWLRVDAMTDAIEQPLYDGAHSAVFYAKITYSDGSLCTLTATLETGERSAAQVAQMALSDASYQYEAQTRAFLEAIATRQ